MATREIQSWMTPVIIVISGCIIDKAWYNHMICIDMSSIYIWYIIDISLCIGWVGWRVLGLARKIKVHGKCLCQRGEVKSFSSGLALWQRIADGLLCVRYFISGDKASAYWTMWHRDLILLCFQHQCIPAMFVTLPNEPLVVGPCKHWYWLEALNKNWPSLLPLSLPSTATDWGAFQGRISLDSGGPPPSSRKVCMVLSRTTEIS